jgi:hypothetical protein
VSIGESGGFSMNVKLRDSMDDGKIKKGEKKLF